VSHTSAEKDFRRANDMRALKKGVQSVDAKRVIDATADRLERRGVKKLRLVGVGKPKQLLQRGPRIPTIGGIPNTPEEGGTPYTGKGVEWRGAI